MFTNFICIVHGQTLQLFAREAPVFAPYPEKKIKNTLAFRSNGKILIEKGFVRLAF